MKITGISLWGDSIGKGIIFDEARGRYAIYRDNLFNVLRGALDIPVENYAMMGATAGYGAERMDKAQLRPGSVAVIEFGGNDCDMPWEDIAREPGGEYAPRMPIDEFSDALRHMIARARAAGAIPVLVTPPPLDARRYFEWISRGRCAENIIKYLGDVQYIYRWQEHYANRVRALARETGAMLCDLRDRLLLCRNIDRLLCVDGIHPNPDGYGLIREFACERLDISFGIKV